MYRNTIALIFIFILTGCALGDSPLPSEMNPKDLPEGRAFEDEFTRSLIQSTEEVSPGYYPFEAKNQTYKMTFPKDGLTDTFGYTSEHDFESIVFNDYEEGKPFSAIIDVKYYDSYKPDTDIDRRKKSFEEHLGYSLEFEQISETDETYYIAPKVEEYDEESGLTLFGLVAYIQNKNEAGGINVIYSFYCEENCEQVKEEELNKAKDWIQTIHFLNDETEGDDS